MNKKIAIIADVHGNLESLTAILKDIKNRNFDEIICLGDTIGIGPNSKECIDLLIKNNIKMVLGNHELYLLNGISIEHSITSEEKEHHKWIKNQLKEKEINYIKNCPLYFEYKIKYNNIIPDKKIIFSHYLIEDPKKEQPFEQNHLKKDIGLWIKYNNERKLYIIGHLHNSFNINEVDGISGDIIEQTGELTNIEIVDSAGCSKNDIVSYTSLEISKGIKIEKIKVKYERGKFIKKVIGTDFPDKKILLNIFTAYKFKYNKKR